MMNLNLIEHHPQRVLEAFRRGEFDHIEVIGHADEKEFFRALLPGETFAGFGPGTAHPRQEEGGASVVRSGGPAQLEAAP